MERGSSFSPPCRRGAFLCIKTSARGRFTFSIIHYQYQAKTEEGVKE